MAVHDTRFTGPSVCVACFGLGQGCLEVIAAAHITRMAGPGNNPVQGFAT
jgi:hypothetical protein